MVGLDPYNSEKIAAAFNIAPAMAAEIMFMNDEWCGGGYPGEQPDKRWTRMRAWVEKHILPASPTSTEGV